MTDHIRPHVHEADVFLWFTDHGLSPYWAVSKLCLDECDGHGEVDVDLLGDRWHVDLAYSDSGFQPRDSDPVGADVLKEFELHLEGPGEKKAHFNISPRADDLRKTDGELASFPWVGGEGLDVHAESANVWLADLPQLLRGALHAVADDVGMSLRDDYFSRPLPESNIVTLELYVRFTRDYGKKVVATDGPLFRLMHLLADLEGIVWEYVANNKEIVGQRHAFDLGAAAAAELGPDHSLGKRLKCYHPKRVRSEETEDDPLSSPKWGAAYHKSLSDEAVNWGEQDELYRELEEVVVGVLDWAGVPTEPDPTTYVADDHFTVTSSDRDVARLADPTPRLEADQNLKLFHVLDDLSPSAEAMTKQLATDGGVAHYEELADETGYSISQLYRALEDLSGLLENENGKVRFISEKVREEVLGMIETFQDLGESVSERVARMCDVELRSACDDALEKWLAKYGADLVERQPDPDDPTTDEARDVVRLGTVLSMLKSEWRGYDHLEDALEAGLAAWRDAGRDPAAFRAMRYEATEVKAGPDSARVGKILD